MGSCPHGVVGAGVLGWCQHLGDGTWRRRGVAGVLAGGWVSCHEEMEDVMKKGMVPEAVEQMGQRIEESGEEAQQIYRQAFSRLEGLDWTGDDRDRFVSEFEGTVGQAVQQLQQRAMALADKARQNAQAQRGASS